VQPAPVAGDGEVAGAVGAADRHPGPLQPAEQGGVRVVVDVARADAHEDGTGRDRGEELR
jgi:hypothetical protein